MRKSLLRQGHTRGYKNQISSCTAIEPSLGYAVGSCVSCLALSIGLTTEDRGLVCRTEPCTENNTDSFTTACKSPRRPKAAARPRSSAEAGMWQGGYAELARRGEAGRRTGWTERPQAWGLGRQTCGGVVAGRCCPEPALCERNGEAVRYAAVESLYPDLGGVR